jgi:hypothetical protein
VLKICLQLRRPYIMEWWYWWWVDWMAVRRKLCWHYRGTIWRGGGNCRKSQSRQTDVQAEIRTEHRRNKRADRYRSSSLVTTTDVSMKNVPAQLPKSCECD